ncbi:unnamed protein product, partial [Allacma fusca]
NSWQPVVLSEANRAYHIISNYTKGTQSSYSSLSCKSSQNFARSRRKNHQNHEIDFSRVTVPWPQFYPDLTREFECFSFWNAFTRRPYAVSARGSNDKLQGRQGVECLDKCRLSKVRKIWTLIQICWIH